jgi:hypothetical protein
VGARRWQAAAHDPSFSDIAQRAHLPEPFIANMRGVVQPGSTMVFTDQPVTRETQSALGFTVMRVG